MAPLDDGGTEIYRESMTHTISPSGQCQHPIWEAFSAAVVGTLSHDGKFTEHAHQEKRILKGAVFKSFRLTGGAEHITSLTLMVAGQPVWETGTITEEEYQPLGVEWPFWSNMQYSNIFLSIEGEPGASVTVTDTSQSQPHSHLLEMSEKALELEPKGDNPFNIAKVKISSGMTGCSFNKREA